MSKILILNASPVKGSSTGIMLAEMARGIKEDPVRKWEEEVISLNDYTYRPCQSCGFSPEPDYCIFHDDLYPVYQKVLDCDIILFGTPIYFDTVSSQAKLFIDRCNCLRPPDFKQEGGSHFKNIIAKKRLGAMVLVCGQREQWECARKVIAGWFKWVWVENLGQVVFAHDSWKTGPVREDLSKLAEAFSLGQLISRRLS